MNISVVIPNFNGENLLRKNLSHLVSILEKHKEGTCEIIITDDASKDASVQYIQNCIKKNHSTVSLLLLENNSGKNKGFSGNVNKGVAKATGDILILLNTDVVPRKDFLFPLLQHFSEKKVFAVGCMDESIENEKVVLRGRGVGKWRKGFLIHGPGELDKETTLWVSCGSGAFRKEIWDKIGGLNELYNPFYWEDIDLSYRAQKAGYTVVFEKKSIVRHEHDSGSIKKNYTPFNVTKIAYRNQFYFTWLNATDKMILLSHYIFVPYFLLKALFNGNTGMLYGFFLAVGHLGKVLQERQKIQRMVVESDKEVVKKVG